MTKTYRFWTETRSGVYREWNGLTQLQAKRWYNAMRKTLPEYIVGFGWEEEA